MASGQVMSGDKRGSWCGVMPSTIPPPRLRDDAPVCAGLVAGPMAGAACVPKAPWRSHPVIRRQTLPRYIVAQSNSSKAFTSP